MNPSRRSFLKGCGGVAALSLLPASVRRVLAAPARGGSLQDVQHVIILMQENRAFDHYFGSMRGVRGFSDRFPVPLPNGEPVWQQRDDAGRLILPWHLDTASTNAQRIEGTPHSWPDAQEAWNDGRMDRWIPAKTERTMGFYREQDLAFQYALADAFTICDAYHASIHAGTNPNRLFLWTGTNDPHGLHHGPAIVNDFDDLGPSDEGWTWHTYPERLQAAGIDWRIYQDMADNFTNNPLEGFRHYRALVGRRHPLAKRALSTVPLERFEHDARAGRLPQVSWLIAPAKYSEHPGPSSPLWGAEYLARVLDALASNEALWNRSVLLVNFDENDGFFDHMPPPAPPSRDDDGHLHGASSVPLDGEYHLSRSGPSFGNARWDNPAWYGRAYGLGPRVPMYVISPWSRGGWVNSQVFDHTSVLRFLEARFGVYEPQISPWRRSVCGDLTSTLDFSVPRDSRPQVPAFGIDDADREVALQTARPTPQPPASPDMPQQQPGVRPSRALPYALDVTESVSDRGFALRFANTGGVGAVFHVYERAADAARRQRPPRRYTVDAGDALTGTWALPESTASPIHLCVYAPNGFYREYRGIAPWHAELLQQAAGTLELRLHNTGSNPITLEVQNHYRPQHAQRIVLTGRQSRLLPVEIVSSGHWYDLLVTQAGSAGILRRHAGRIETGQHGISDPG